MNTEELDGEFVDLFNCKRLSDEIHAATEELNEMFLKANSMQTMLKETNSIGISIERLQDIHTTIASYGIVLPEFTNRKDLQEQLTISYEGKTLSHILDAIDALIKKIWELLKNYVAINRILANYLDREIKYGVFANVRKINISKYEFLVSPFYKKYDLQHAVAVLSPINYRDQIREADTLEHAVGEPICKAAGELGWMILNNSVSKQSTKIINTPIVSLGWAIDDIPVMARTINLLLMNNVIEGRRAVKYYENVIKDTKFIPNADVLRRRLSHIQKIVSMVQDIGVDVAWCILLIGRKLK